MAYIEDAGGIQCTSFRAIDQMCSQTENVIVVGKKWHCIALAPFPVPFVTQQWRLLFTLAMTASLGGTDRCLIMSNAGSRVPLREPGWVTGWPRMKCSSVLTNKQTCRKATNRTWNAFALVTISTNTILLQECCGQRKRPETVREKQTVVRSLNGLLLKLLLLDSVYIDIYWYYKRKMTPVGWYLTHQLKTFAWCVK